MNRKLLNEYTNKYKMRELIQYISNEYNLQKEKLSIKIIDTFQNKQLTIDIQNNFVIILNNSIHDEISINNIKFKEVLIIDSDSNIEIDTDLTYSDIKYILIENSSKKNSIEDKNKYLQGDNIFLINDLKIFNKDHCDLINRFIDNNIENKSINKTSGDHNINRQSLSYMISKNHPNKILNKKIDNLLFNVIKNLISHLRKENKIPILDNIIADTGYQFCKIFGESTSRFDGVHGFIEDTKERFLSVIICLNDDYEGGEICFPVQNRIIKMKKGDILVYPPYWTHPHYSNDFLNKTYRYTINTWLY